MTKPKTSILIAPAGDISFIPVMIQDRDVSPYEQRKQRIEQFEAPRPARAIRRVGALFSSRKDTQ